MKLEIHQVYYLGFCRSQKCFSGKTSYIWWIHHFFFLRKNNFCRFYGYKGNTYLIVQQITTEIYALYIHC